MNKLPVFILCSLFIINSYGQDSTRMARQQQKLRDSLNRLERRSNIYAHRKYGISVSWSPYANLAHKINSFGALDISFSNRITWLDIGNNASLETNIGLGFQPYQGTRINLGFDYELLSKKYKVHPYIGCQYSLGLAQASSQDDNASIKMGFHNYFMPYAGIMWWPGKEDISSKDNTKKYLYEHPRFRQLFYFKFQVGYSWLLGNVQADTTGPFSDHLYQIIRYNTANTLQLKISVGLNIPTSGPRREKYFRLLEEQNLKVE